MAHSILRFRCPRSPKRRKTWKAFDETSLSWAGKTLRTKSGGEATVSLSFSPGIDLGNVAGSEEQVFAAPALRGLEFFGH